MELTAAQRAHLQALRRAGAVTPVELPEHVKLRRLGLVEMHSIRPGGVRVDLTLLGRQMIYSPHDEK